MNNPNEIKVWDPLVRSFHWVLVGAYLIAWLSEDDLEWLHVNAGYTIFGLIVVRLIWGFIGTQYARFSQFVMPFSAVKAHLKSVVKLHPDPHVGHNPVGGWMILALLASLLMATLSGMACYAAESQAGPLAAWFGQLSESQAHVWEEVHEFFANFSLLLVTIHVGGVVVESLLQRENLIRAMITGRKTQHH